MALQPQVKKEVTSLYHVYDDSVGDNLGGVKIEMRGEGSGIHRVVKLNSDQATYFLTQGVIGTKPFTSLDPEQKERYHHLTGGGVPKADEEKRPAPAQTPSVPKVDKGMTFQDEKGGPGKK